MENATPSDTAIKKIISKIDDFIGHCYFYFIDGNKPSIDEIFADEKLEEMYQKIISAIESLNNLNYISDKKFEQIKRLFRTTDEDILYRASLYFDSKRVNSRSYLFDLLPEISFEDEFENSPFLKRFSKIKELLTKQLSKEEKAKTIIKGLTQPVRWEDITLLFDGGNFVVFQDKKDLGTYSLSELNFPKFKTRNREKELRTVRGFLISLFSYRQKEIRHILNYQDANNQKLKEKFVKVLQNAFQTNKDPVRKNEIDFIYEPVFNIKFSGALGINNFRSGKEEYDDNIDYENHLNN